MATTPADFTDAYFEEMEDLENRHPWTRSMRVLTLQLLAHATPSDILDVGCGTGGFLKDWLRLAPQARAVGIDFARPALERSRKRLSAGWIQASAADLPFAERSFDAIHCADVLQHLSLAETERAFDGFASLIRPGGLLALRVRATRFRRNEPNLDYSHAFTTQSLRKALETRGLSVRMVSRTNAIGSLWAELAAPATSGTAVGGIRRERSGGVRAAVLRTALAMERGWIRAGLPVPVGHTIIAVAERR